MATEREPGALEADLKVSFFLPAGSYATVALRELLGR
jgi:tRNA(Glu) U13 pseudouridine synthase TruD